MNSCFELKIMFSLTFTDNINRIRNFIESNCKSHRNSINLNIYITYISFPFFFPSSTWLKHGKLNIQMLSVVTWMKVEKLYFLQYHIWTDLHILVKQLWRHSSGLKRTKNIKFNSIHTKLHIKLNQQNKCLRTIFNSFRTHKVK